MAPISGEKTAQRRVHSLSAHLGGLAASPVSGSLAPIASPYAESSEVPPSSVPWHGKLEQVAVRTKLSRELDETDPGIVRQRQQGKLTCRERIAILLDPGSFREHGSITGATRYGRDDSEKLVAFQRFVEWTCLRTLDSSEPWIVWNQGESYLWTRGD
jgi:hypothetical protein